MDVYWLEQARANLPSGLEWLSKSETEKCKAFHLEKRRGDWLLGRWTGKLAVAAHLGLQQEVATLRTIEIVATPSGAPEVFVSGKLLDVAISLTHSGDAAACALGSGRALGCDIEQVEPRSNSFLEDYFTVEEQSLLRRSTLAEQWRLAALLWSAKESTLKALRVGLRLDTRCVRVILDSDRMQPSKEHEWLPLRVRYTGGQVFSGWWREAGKLVQTLVADPAPGVPVDYAALSTEHGAARR